MLLEIAEEKRIDLNAIDDTELEQEEKNLEEYADNHSLSFQSKEYSNLLIKWFDENEESLEKKEQEINQSIALNINREKTLKEFKALKNAVEIIRWYSFQIHVKLMRALRHGEPDLDFEDSIQNDANGSAKIVLIGTEKSLGALGVLHSQLPKLEDTILNILLVLEIIRKEIFKIFPKVNEFVRPGFDETCEIVYKKLSFRPVRTHF